MIGPNLSEWALGKRSLVIFLMIVAVVAGTLSFLRLGRGEDPAFTFRTMIVAAAWPGATVDETLLQVTERLERKLQETHHLDTGAQLHDGRTDDDLRRSPSSRRRRPRCPTSGTRSARTSATSGRRFPPASSARSSTTTSATPTASSTRSPPTASRSASCATTLRPRVRACCRCLTCRRSKCWARRTSRSTSSSRPSGWPASASTIRRSSRPCRRKTSSGPPASSRLARSACSCAFQRRVR